MTHQTPAITVLMPVYNAAAYVGQAIESILSQSFHDFEFIIINDGSTDGSEQVILSYSDPRIRYINNDGNKGLIYTLNRGMAMAQGDYIARMDADDISQPQRLEKQLAEFKKDPELVICGSFIKTFGRSESYIDYMAATNAQILSAIFIACPFAHPSVMLKKQALLKLDEVYRSDYKHAEDYDLWSRLVFTGHSKNIPEFLLHYREHDQQVSTVYQDIKYRTVEKIQLNLLHRLGLEPTAEEKAFHLNFFKGISRQSPEYLEMGAAWLGKFRQAFANLYPQYTNDFNRMLSTRWLKITGNSGLGMKGINLTFGGSFFRVKYVKFKDLIKFFYKTLSGYKQVEHNDGA